MDLVSPLHHLDHFEVFCSGVGRSCFKYVIIGLRNDTIFVFDIFDSLLFKLCIGFCALVPLLCSVLVFDMIVLLIRLRDDILFVSGIIVILRIDLFVGNGLWIGCRIIVG
eukprot:139250_1